MKAIIHFVKILLNIRLTNAIIVKDKSIMFQNYWMELYLHNYWMNCI